MQAPVIHGRRRALSGPNHARASSLGSALFLFALLFVGACESTGPRVGPVSLHYEDVGSAAADLDAAREAIARGADAEALPLLRRVLEVRPDHVRTHLLYQDAARRVGGTAEEAMRAYYDALPESSSSAAILYAKARLAPTPYEREQLLDRVLELDPSFPWAYLSRARMRRSMGNAAKALQALDAALRAQPSFAEACLERAEVLEELGRYEEAGTDYANYVRVRPTDRDVLEQYVRLLIYKLGRLEAANPIVAQMVRDDPGDLDARMNYAAIHWLAGRRDQAAAEYREVLRRDSSAARAVLNLGNLHYEAVPPGGDAEQRRASLTRARKAYLYYRNLSLTDGIFDLLDLHFAVPFRLKVIAAEIGEDDGRPPRLGDF